LSNYDILLPLSVSKYCYLNLPNYDLGLNFAYFYDCPFNPLFKEDEPALEFWKSWNDCDPEIGDWILVLEGETYLYLILLGLNYFSLINNYGCSRFC
jgi:hypothetical protein